MMLQLTSISLLFFKVQLGLKQVHTLTVYPGRCQLFALIPQGTLMAQNPETASCAQSRKPHNRGISARTSMSLWQWRFVCVCEGKWKAWNSLKGLQTDLCDMLFNYLWSGHTVRHHHTSLPTSTSIDLGLNGEHSRSWESSRIAMKCIRHRDFLVSLLVLSFLLTEQLQLRGVGWLPRMLQVLVQHFYELQVRTLTCTFQNRKFPTCVFRVVVLLHYPLSYTGTLTFLKLYWTCTAQNAQLLQWWRVVLVQRQHRRSTSWYRRTMFHRRDKS